MNSTNIDALMVYELLPSVLNLVAEKLNRDEWEVKPRLLNEFGSKLRRSEAGYMDKPAQKGRAASSNQSFQDP